MPLNVIPSTTVPKLRVVGVGVALVIIDYLMQSECTKGFNFFATEEAFVF